MSRLALYLLGPPRIECDGGPVDIRRRKAIALLAYLAMTGQNPCPGDHHRGFNRERFATHLSFVQVGGGGSVGVCSALLWAQQLDPQDTLYGSDSVSPGSPQNQRAKAGEDEVPQWRKRLLSGQRGSGSGSGGQG